MNTTQDSEATLSPFDELVYHLLRTAGCLDRGESRDNSTPEEGMLDEMKAALFHPLLVKQGADWVPMTVSQALDGVGIRYRRLYQALVLGLGWHHGTISAELAARSPWSESMGPGLADLKREFSRFDAEAHLRGLALRSLPASRQGSAGELAALARPLAPSQHRCYLDREEIAPTAVLKKLREPNGPRLAVLVFDPCGGSSSYVNAGIHAEAVLNPSWGLLPLRISGGGAGSALSEELRNSEQALSAILQQEALLASLCEEELQDSQAVMVAPRLLFLLDVPECTEGDGGPNNATESAAHEINLTWMDPLIQLVMKRPQRGRAVICARPGAVASLQKVLESHRVEDQLVLFPPPIRPPSLHQCFQGILQASGVSGDKQLIRSSQDAILNMERHEHTFPDQSDRLVVTQSYGFHLRNELEGTKGRPTRARPGNPNTIGAAECLTSYLKELINTAITAPAGESSKAEKATRRSNTISILRALLPTSLTESARWFSEDEVGAQVSRLGAEFAQDEIQACLAGLVQVGLVKQRNSNMLEQYRLQPWAIIPIRQEYGVPSMAVEMLRRFYLMWRDLRVLPPTEREDWLIYLRQAGDDPRLAELRHDYLDFEEFRTTWCDELNRVGEKDEKAWNNRLISLRRLLDEHNIVQHDLAEQRELTEKIESQLERTRSRVGQLQTICLSCSVCRGQICASRLDLAAMLPRQEVVAEPDWVAVIAEPDSVSVIEMLKGRYQEWEEELTGHTTQPAEGAVSSRERQAPPVREPPIRKKPWRHSRVAAFGLGVVISGLMGLVVCHLKTPVRVSAPPPDHRNQRTAQAPLDPTQPDMTVRPSMKGSMTVSPTPPPRPTQQPKPKLPPGYVVAIRSKEESSLATSLGKISSEYYVGFCALEATATFSPNEWKSRSGYREAYNQIRQRLTQEDHDSMKRHSPIWLSITSSDPRPTPYGDQLSLLPTAKQKLITKISVARGQWLLEQTFDSVKKHLKTAVPGYVLLEDRIAPNCTGHEGSCTDAASKACRGASLETCRDIYRKACVETHKQACQAQETRQGILCLLVRRCSK